MIDKMAFEYKVPAFEFSPASCHGQTEPEMKNLLKSYRVQSGKSRQSTQLKSPTIEQILSVTLNRMQI